MTKKWLYDLKRREEKEKMAFGQAAREQFNFTEIKDVPLFKFEKEGDMCEGFLISVDPVEIGDNKTRTNAYTLELFRGGRVKIHGTRQINDKLGPHCLGRPVRVKFLGKDQEAGKNGNAFHRFYVGVDWNDQVKKSDLIITDADVGF